MEAAHDLSCFKSEQSRAGERALRDLWGDDLFKKPQIA
jgi:hypothetical protein